MEKSEVISTLNDLLKTTKDGQDGFRTCAEQVKGANLKSVFETAASRCDEGAAELKAKISQPRRRACRKRHGVGLATSRLDEYQVFHHWNG